MVFANFSLYIIGVPFAPIANDLQTIKSTIVLTLIDPNNQQALMFDIFKSRYFGLGPVYQL